MSKIWSHLLKKSLMENFIFCTVGISMIVASTRVNRDPGDGLGILVEYKFFGAVPLVATYKKIKYFYFFQIFQIFSYCENDADSV